MVATGITRRLDNLGRIVIPKEIRKAYGINNNSKLAIKVEGDLIILTVSKDNEL